MKPEQPHRESTSEDFDGHVERSFSKMTALQRLQWLDNTRAFLAQVSDAKEKKRPVNSDV